MTAGEGAVLPLAGPEDEETVGRGATGFDRCADSCDESEDDDVLGFAVRPAGDEERRSPSPFVASLALPPPAPDMLKGSVPV